MVSVLKDSLTYKYGDANSRVNASGTGIGVAGPHAVTSLSDGTVFKYDANGNMVSLAKGTNTTTYTYDVQNRLQKVTVGALTVAVYLYDGDGARTEKTVYRRDLALYNENVNPLLFGNTVATASNQNTDTTIAVGHLYETESGVSRNSKFIYLGSTRVASVGSDGSVLYYHTDHLGGTNVVSDAAGALRELSTYDPYGQVFAHNKFGSSFATIWWYFTGKPLDDETGLIFLGARYYNPQLGRFITPDTVVPYPGNPQSLNRYTYCGNNPINAIDPSGHKHHKHHWWSWIADIGLATVAVVAVAFLPVTAPGIAGFVSSVVAGATAGAAIGGFTSSITGGDWGQGVLTGAISGAIFGGIGHFQLGGFAQIAAHAAGGAASGAISAEITGDNVGINALIGGLSAGASQWAGQANGLFKLTGYYLQDVVRQAALGGIIGGATSTAFGGNFWRGFANGAETSAIAFTANDASHNGELENFVNGIKGWASDTWDGITQEYQTNEGAILALAPELKGAQYLLNGDVWFARNVGVLNNNPYFRIGWGWSGPTQSEVFRISIGSRNTYIYGQRIWWHSPDLGKR